MNLTELIEQAKRDVHERLMKLDDDYRFECACCGEDVVYERNAWLDLRVRLERIMMGSGFIERFNTHAIDAMAYAMAQKIDADIVRSFQK